ncbi:MerR family transcriptional regulator [Oceanicoccus sagamiensis]|uniref:MerR family transcriptional regulator n=1 Tax=Oceanicoccus sagamiensis TaxID=716816 RepID=A0A1X9NFC4_9GAMM|nr:MerR family DNA-binding transcriptional regulator [Oceanicoccus sagamiensis]ARN76226.1 MerR family transcriptional regulator [Oceanicoccus sagamiensis]
MSKVRQYTISELAAEFDVTTRTIRFYEEKGLLAPERKGTSRIYSSADHTKLKLILRGKRLGFSLEESGEIISMYDPDHGNAAQLKKLMTMIQTRREQLASQLEDLQVMMLELEQVEQRAAEALGKS